MPVTAVAGQSRDLEPKHQSRSAQAHFRHQPLKTDTVGSGGSGLPKIRVDDNDLFFCPAQPECLLSKAILTLRTLLMFEHLSRSGLANVEIGVPLTMCSLNFALAFDHEIALW